MNLTILKQKNFPLFSEGCDYTDDTIMTVAVAKAILLTYKQRLKSSTLGFQNILINVMQEFGAKYPNPTGEYGSGFKCWLHQKDPKPYGSYGNGYANTIIISEIKDS